MGVTHGILQSKAASRVPCNRDERFEHPVSPSDDILNLWHPFRALSMGIVGSKICQANRGDFDAAQAGSCRLTQVLFSHMSPCRTSSLMLHSAVLKLVWATETHGRNRLLVKNVLMHEILQLGSMYLNMARSPACSFTPRRLNPSRHVALSVVNRPGDEFTKFTRLPSIRDSALRLISVAQINLPTTGQRTHRFSFLHIVAFDYL